MSHFLLYRISLVPDNSLFESLKSIKLKLLPFFFLLASISHHILHMNGKIVPHQFIEKGLVVDAVDYELSLTDVLEAFMAASHLNDFALAYFEHVDEQDHETVILVIHENYPVKDSGRNMDRDVGTETHRENGVAVHVLPNVDDPSLAPAIFVEQIVQVGSDRWDAGVQLLDLGIVILIIVFEVVHSPVQVEHQLDQKVVHLLLTLPKVLQKTRDYVHEALVLESDHRVWIDVCFDDFDDFVLWCMNEFKWLRALQDWVSLVTLVIG